MSEIRIERYFPLGISEQTQNFQAISQIEFKRESFLLAFGNLSKYLRQIEWNFWRLRNNRREWKWYLNWYIIYTNFWYFPENMFLINGVYTFWISNCCLASCGGVGEGNLDRLRKFLTLIVHSCRRLFVYSFFYFDFTLGVYSSSND